MPVSIAAAELAAEIGAETTRAERLLDVATRVAETYAPDAPDELLNEAVVRCAGYLAQSDFGGVRSETIGPRSVEYVVNHAALWRNSGAAALLTRWRRRRGGLIR